MLYITNPFLFGAYLAPHYFCDRTTETHLLIEHIQNGRNVVLAAPRRIGKTGLIQHLFMQPQITDKFYCVYCDVMPTDSLQMFLYRLSSAVLHQLKKRSLLQRLTLAVKSMRFSVAIDPTTGEPSFGINIGGVENPPQALSEIFAFLNSLDRPVILAIDEFQQVAEYKDASVEADLRSIIQFSPNIRLIYSGSKEHLLVSMFSEPKRPFFRGGSFVNLQPIDRDIYVRFAQNLFSEYGKTLTVDVFNQIYDQVDGITYYVQFLLNILFAKLPPATASTAAYFDATLNDAISQGAMGYLRDLKNLTKNQQSLIIAIAQEKCVEEIQSTLFLRRHDLLSSSSVQAAAASMIKSDYIEKTDQGYRVYDPLFAEWLRRDSAHS